MPSLFSLSNYVDFIWLANGFRLDQGGTSFTHLSGRQGGIQGLSYLGEPLAVSISEDQISVTSQPLGNPVLNAAEGQTAVAGEQPSLDLDVSVAGRCMAGKIYLSVAVTNPGSDPVAVSVVTAYGSKQYPAVAPSATVSQSFVARQPLVGPGQVMVGGVAGQLSVNQSVAYPGWACT
jgi:hypothetical protein